MTGISVSAPGKLLLCGEYAVLRDAPAVIMAVDRRAIVSVSAGDNPWHTVTTPGLSDRTFRFELRDGNQLSWLEESPDTPPGIPAAVLRHAAVKLEKPLRIEIDTRAFVDSTGAKFGLGSSAAATVALTRALLGQDADRAAVWTTARQAHGCSRRWS